MVGVNLISPVNSAVATIECGGVWRQRQNENSPKRGNLSPARDIGNPVLNRGLNSEMCRDYRESIRRTDDKIVQPPVKAGKGCTTPTYSSSVVSLAGVLTIIFVTVIILGAVAWIANPVPLKSNLKVIMRRIRGNLSLRGYGNPELSSGLCPDKCVETMGCASLVEDKIVRYPVERRGERLGLQGVAS